MGLAYIFIIPLKYYKKKYYPEIKGFLVKNGIKKGQIKVKGYGPTRPKFSNDSEELRVKNRRVEIYIN